MQHVNVTPNSARSGSVLNYQWLSCHKLQEFRNLQFRIRLRPMPVLCRKEWIYRHTFWRSDSGVILRSCLSAVTKFWREPWAEALYIRGYDFFLQISPFICTRNSAIADKPRDTFIFKKYRDIQTGVRGHWRSLEMSPFDTAHATSYWCSIVTMAL